MYPSNYDVGYSFEEGIPILYTTNTLMFEKSEDWIPFKHITEPYAYLLRSLEFNLFDRDGFNRTQFDLASVCRSISAHVEPSNLLRLKFSLLERCRDYHQVDYEKMMKPIINWFCRPGLAPKIDIYITSYLLDGGYDEEVEKVKAFFSHMDNRKPEIIFIPVCSDGEEDLIESEGEGFVYEE